MSNLDKRVISLVKKSNDLNQMYKKILKKACFYQDTATSYIQIKLG
jgi:hypothetical protein